MARQSSVGCEYDWRVSAVFWSWIEKILIYLTVFETNNEMRVHIRFMRTCGIFRVRGVIVRMPNLLSQKVCLPNSIWHSQASANKNTMRVPIYCASQVRVRLMVACRALGLQPDGTITSLPLPHSPSWVFFLIEWSYVLFGLPNPLRRLSAPCLTILCHDILLLCSSPIRVTHSVS